MPAGQLTLVVHLNRPVCLPDLERQCNVDEISRLVLGLHEEMQREAQGEEAQGEGTGERPAPGSDGDEGAVAGVAAGAEAPTAEAASPSTSGPSRATAAAAESQPFVLPLGVIARNEEYPRSCRMW